MLTLSPFPEVRFFLAQFLPGMINQSLHAPVELMAAVNGTLHY